MYFTFKNTDELVKKPFGVKFTNASNILYLYLISNLAESFGLVFTKYGSIVVDFTLEFKNLLSLSKHSIKPTQNKRCKQNAYVGFIILFDVQSAADVEIWNGGGPNLYLPK